jgi:methyl-accepting chemotaxis protein
MGIRSRTLAVAAAGMGLILLAAAGGLYMSWRSLQTFELDVMARQRDAVAVLAAESDFKKQVQEWKDTLLRGADPDLLQKHWTAFQSREEVVRDEIRRLSAAVADPEAAKLLEQFIDAHQEMGAAYRRGFEQFEAANFDPRVGDKAVTGIDRAPTELLTRAKDRIQAEAQRRASEAASAGRVAISASAIVMIVATGLSLLLFAITVGRTVTTPIIRAVAVMRRLAEGDLAVDIAVSDSRDEIGAMARAIAVFKRNAIERQALQEREMAEIARREERARRRDAATAAFNTDVAGILNMVTSASTELDSTAASLSATAEEASRQAAVVAAGAEEANANVATVAAATEELSASIGEISHQMVEARTVAGHANEESKRANERIQGLVDSAQRIGEVVRLIQDIASQTNLLALNATIEAARAGEAGKGFAVVANEVKTLASQTARATEEITGQVQAVQGSTQEAVQAIAGIGSTIARIHEISATIAAAVEEQGAATNEIARNVALAAAGTSEVTNNIAAVNEVARETGESAAQVLAATGELNTQSSRLKDVIDSFLHEMATT